MVIFKAFFQERSSTGFYLPDLYFFRLWKLVETALEGI